MAVSQYFTIELPSAAQVEDYVHGVEGWTSYTVTLSRPDAETLCDDLAQALYPGDPRVSVNGFEVPLEGPQWTPPEPGEPATYQGISLEEAERRLAAQQVSQDRETPPKTSGGSSIGNLPV